MLDSKHQPIVKSFNRLFNETASLMRMGSPDEKFPFDGSFQSSSNSGGSLGKGGRGKLPFEIKPHMSESPDIPSKDGVSKRHLDQLFCKMKQNRLVQLAKT